MQAKKKGKKESRKEIVGNAALRSVENDGFRDYYMRQLCLSSEEWAVIEHCLRQPLPVTYRFSGFDGQALARRDAMERSSVLDGRPRRMSASGKARRRTAPPSRRCSPGEAAPRGQATVRTGFVGTRTRSIQRSSSTLATTSIEFQTFRDAQSCTSAFASTALAFAPFTPGILSR